MCDWQYNWDQIICQRLVFIFNLCREHSEATKLHFMVKPACKGMGGGLEFFLLWPSCEFRKGGKSFN